jgi:hypothetical protein
MPYCHPSLLNQSSQLAKCLNMLEMLEYMLSLIGVPQKDLIHFWIHMLHILITHQMSSKVDESYTPRLISSHSYKYLCLIPSNSAFGVAPITPYHAYHTQQ